MVRNLAMTTRLEDIAGTVVKTVNDRPVNISDVAQWCGDPNPCAARPASTTSPASS